MMKGKRRKGQYETEYGDLGGCHQGILNAMEQYISFQISIQYFLCMSMLLVLYCTYVMFESYIIPFSFLDQKCEMGFFTGFTNERK